MPQFDFHPRATKFDFLNALRLAEASDLAYQPLPAVEKQVLSDWGFSQLKFFDKCETQAFIATNEDIILFAFRGTTCKGDWLANLKVKFVSSVTGKIHCGFNEALDHIWSDLFQAFNEWEDPDKTIWLTGHSLGGALATLTADRLVRELFPIAGLYTFGQPCVGNRQFAKHFNDEMRGKAFRFVNEEDLVPKLLPFPMYCHIGEEYFIDRDGKIFNINNFRHWWRSASESVAIRSSENASKLRAKNPGGVLDHGPTFYIQAIKKKLQEPAQVKSFKDYINT